MQFTNDYQSEEKGVFQALPRSYRNFAIAFAVAWLAICILILSPTMNNTTNVSAVEVNGVGVYWDSRCSNRVFSIEWGTLNPGSVKNVAVYIRNEVGEPMYLILSETNWNPSKASQYLNLRWNYPGQRMNPGEKLQITLTLSVSRSIEGISSFSFNIVITASDRLVGDINGDGIVDMADVRRAARAYESRAVDDPTTPWDETERWDPAADLNNNGTIDIADIRTIARAIL